MPEHDAPERVSDELLDDMIKDCMCEDGRVWAISIELHSILTELKERRAGDPATADAAINRIWSEWFTFYEKHFRAPGVAISAADQIAFYEIAQPILRELASPAPVSGVTVMPLEWEMSEGSTSSRTRRLITHRAMTPFGAFFIEHDAGEDAWWATWGLLGDVVVGPCTSNGGIREAVDAHYAALLRAALSLPTPSDQPAEVGEFAAVAGEFAIEEREDDMFITAPDWVFGKRCVALRPKMTTNDKWRPIAERIVAALNAHFSLSAPPAPVEVTEMHPSLEWCETAGHNAGVLAGKLPNKDDRLAASDAALAIRTLTAALQASKPSDQGADR